MCSASGSLERLGAFNLAPPNREREPRLSSPTRNGSNEEGLPSKRLPPGAASGKVHEPRSPRKTFFTGYPQRLHRDLAGLTSIMTSINKFREASV